MPDINFMTTRQGSLLENFYPQGWDFERIDNCCAMGFDKLTERALHWHEKFKPVPVKDVHGMDKKMGDAIADQIEKTAKKGKPLALILPVGPMGMYKQVVKRIRNSKTKCDHVTTFIWTNGPTRTATPSPAINPADSNTP